MGYMERNTRAQRYSKHFSNNSGLEKVKPWLISQLRPLTASSGCKSNMQWQKETETLVTKVSNVFTIFSFRIKIKKLEHVGKQENQTWWQLRAYFPLPYTSENPDQPSLEPQRQYHCIGSHHFDRKDALLGPWKQGLKHCCSHRCHKWQVT